MELKFLPAGTVLEACWHGVDDGIPEVEDRRRAPEGGAKIVPIPGRNVLDGLPDLHDQLCRAEARGVRVTSRRAQTVREERQPGLNFLCCDDQLSNGVVMLFHRGVRHRLVDPVRQLHKAIMPLLNPTVRTFERPLLASYESR